MRTYRRGATVHIYGLGTDLMNLGNPKLFGDRLRDGRTGASAEPVGEGLRLQPSHIGEFRNRAVPLPQLSFDVLTMEGDCHG
jgi:hypothetical protein